MEREYFIPEWGITIIERDSSINERPIYIRNVFREIEIIPPSMNGNSLQKRIVYLNPIKTIKAEN